jgi:transcriptional regulator with XRE-family HTH domain
MSIGLNIKQRREAKRWTQTELAEKSGIVTQAMISRIEKGEDNAKIDTLRGIAAALGCSVVDLLTEADKKRKLPAGK